MKVLAFDTTNSTLSIAILFDNLLVAKKDIFESNKQAKMLIPLIEDCLKETQIWYQDLDLIALTNGPGSFTGIRIGCSCAKALEIATKLPIISISSLEAIAYNYKSGIYQGKKYQRILVALDARLEELFIQEFRVKNGKILAIFEPKMISIKDIEKFFPKQSFLLAGSGKILIKDNFREENRGQKEKQKEGSFLKKAIISSDQDFINAENIAFLALEKTNYSKAELKKLTIKTPNQEDYNKSQALYIRKPKISNRKTKPQNKIV